MVEIEYTETQKKIQNVCKNLSEFLCEKNRKYGDSALNPNKVFSKLDAIEGIKLRMNDKISRITNSDEPRKNDTWDLMGYMVLLILAKGEGWEDPTDILE